MNYGLLLEKSQKDNFREMCSRNINNFLEDNYIFLGIYMLSYFEIKISKSKPTNTKIQLGMPPCY